MLSGQLENGYARFEDGEGALFQVRWAPCRDLDDLGRATERYLADLSRRESNPVSHHDFGYRLGNRCGTSRLFGTRGFILEVVSNTGPRRLLDGAAESMEIHRRRLPWCLYGLDVFLPEEARLHRKQFWAGRTRLEFKLPVFGGNLVAERWGLASRLLEGKTLEAWVRGLLNWTGHADISDSDRSMMRRGGRRVLALHERDRDRIQLLVANVRRPEWSPTWDWFGGHGQS